MPSLIDRISESFYRIAAGGWLPRSWFLNGCPPLTKLPTRTGHLQLEIVSHCWMYSHLLAYQLSSLVLHPPTKLSVQMTVFYSPEDPQTVELLDFFKKISPPNVTWKWWPLERSSLFRRAIGRNLAALSTQADWMWFTDCDQIFHQDCLDALAGQLSGRNDPLVFPMHVNCTSLLESDDELLQAATRKPAIVEINPERFIPASHKRAVGALQIAHGDAVRMLGYCNSIPFYQRPADRWQKCYEDRAFRWLIGNQGTPIDIPGLFRIEHIQKGRYESNSKSASLRRSIKRWRNR